MVIASSCRMQIGAAKSRASQGQPNHFDGRALSVSHQPITAAGMQRTLVSTGFLDFRLAPMAREYSGKIAMRDVYVWP
jgi:hypothetical protein